MVIKMDNKELIKVISVLSNNLTKLQEQQNEHLNSIRKTLNTFLFFFIVGITIVVINFIMLS
jgi:hypothetical protein